jgi:hypothetical protein
LWAQNRVLWAAIGTFEGVVVVAGFVSGRHFGLLDLMSVSGVLGSWALVQVAARQQKELAEKRRHASA